MRPHDNGGQGDPVLAGEPRRDRAVAEPVFLSAARQLAAYATSNQQPGRWWRRPEEPPPPGVAFA